jgi:hypothetical protein
MTWAEYRAAVEGREYVVTGTFGRSDSAVARAIAVRLAHGYGCELPPAYDRLGAMREARLARQARGERG